MLHTFEDKSCIDKPTDTDSHGGLGTVRELFEEAMTRYRLTATMKAGIILDLDNTKMRNA
jgi:hypothetical protein